ncbi:MAG TPA: GNAT family N-acetyltransferase [Candidatus Cloacimonetes bacterium]|jgi:GNAT superfamily N-acetyltransferase|nr:GNAT family N-acetyltransferase [Candidatus Cloacimonadota bacterium]
MKDISIKQVTKAELMRIYDDSAFWAQEALPFTRPRLACYLQNTRAELEDVLWVMAFKEGKVVGYLALVPELINSREGALKVAWFSSWWVHPKHRGTGLADRLSTLAFDLYDGIAIDSGYHFALKKMKANCDFEIYQLRQRKHYFLSMNKKILQSYQVSNPLIYLLLPLARPLLACISKLRIRRWLNRNRQANLKVEYIHQIDKDSLELIRANADRELVFKDADYLEFRAFLPLKLSTPTFLPEKYHSYFGNVGAEAECRMVKLWEGEELAGIVNYCIVDNTLTIRYHCLLPNHEAKLIYLIAKLCSEHSVDRITTHDALIIRQIKTLRLPYLFCKKLDMPVFLSKSLIGKVKPDLHLFDGEGAF